jgi:hypothetical protein
MTPEERFKKIEENLLVTSEMMRTSDRRWEERFSHLGDNVSEHDARLTRLEEVVASLAGAEQKLFLALENLAHAHDTTDARLEVLTVKLDKVADDQAITRAMLDTLIKNIDNFVRGQGGNGRRGKGGGR